MEKNEVLVQIMTAASRQHILKLVKDLYRYFDSKQAAAYKAGWNDAMEALKETKEQT